MREWMQAVLLSLPIATVGILAPSSARLSRALRSAAAAVMLFALISPLSGLELSSLLTPPSVETFVPEEGAIWQETVREGFCQGLETEIFDRFSMKVEILAAWEEDGTLASVVAILGREALLGDAVGMTHYIEGTWGVDCTVEYREE